MAKRLAARPTGGASQTAVQKKLYRVNPGVAWVNGVRVPPDRKLRLTDAEARFDLEQGRIAPFNASSTRSVRRGGD